MNLSLIKKEPVAIKKYNKSNLIYNGLSFCSYSDDKNFDSLSFKSKHSYLLINIDILWQFAKIDSDETKKFQQDKRKSVQYSETII